MAGHLKLKKDDEKEVFKVLDKLRKVLTNIADLSSIQKFKELEITLDLKTYNLFPLPSDYAFIKGDHVFKVGPFNLTSITDEDPSLTQGINLEVHFREVQVSGKLVVRAAYWVA